MNDHKRAVTEAEIDGVKGYTPFGLRIYDAFVYGLTSPHFWECPGRELLAHYNRHISNNHLDVGVGTGYMLDKCSFTSKSPRLYLFDLNANALATTAQRLARYQPQRLEGSVLSPVPYNGEPFDSIGMNYMIHCVPGSIPEKAVLFDHLAVHLRPGGVIFGSTLLGENARMTPMAQRAFDYFSDKGIFHCRKDNEEDLRQALEARFADVSLRKIGHAAIFSARKRAETSAPA